MKVKSKGIIDGFFMDRYGKRGTVADLSIPFTIEDAPDHTVSFAIVLEDIDAIPVCGFSWIHWIACNITRTVIEEGESKSATDFIQGMNSSWSIQGGQSKDQAIGFTHFGPPDQPHRYDLHVYALVSKLDLKEGFYLNELKKAMEGHIIQEVVLSGVYNHE